MNHIYRSIWSLALGCWMAVSELAKGKSKNSNVKRAERVGVALSAGLLFSHGVYALPTGDQLVAGYATVSQPTANVMQINQGSQRAAINWQGFSVAQQETVNIQQPNQQAALLNRVVGQDASQIQGRINANGQVYLVNPNGVAFGKSAQVDVGGLIATTHEINNSDFMTGKNHFSQTKTGGKIENHGTINAKEGGVVALIGEQVINTGTINTPKGTTALAAGKTVDLDMKGDGLVEVKVTEAALNAQIENHGAINADGGRVVMTAKAANSLMDTVINQKGIVRARGLVERHGEIILDGGDNGTVNVSGELDARNPNLGLNAKGGSIQIKGKRIQLENTAVVDASTSDMASTKLDLSSKGGTIQIGDKQSTEQVTLKQGSIVNASTNQQHPNQGLDSRGTIKILANMHNGTVNVAGKLDASARDTGNGGFIETSAAKVKVASTAKTSTHAQHGQSGTWLIDPNDFNIGGTNSDMSGLTLSTNLTSGNVTIQSTSGASGTAGDVNVNDAVDWSANTLTLNAQRHIHLNANLNGSGTAKLALLFAQASTDGSSDGDTLFSKNVKVNLAAGQNLSTQKGSDVANLKNYTVITELGAEGSTTATDLQGMNGNLAGYYALGADIDASVTSGWNGGAGFLPIASSSDWSNSFTGAFDGLGHTITGLIINRPDSYEPAGLFGTTYNGSTLSNIGLVGSRVIGGGTVGSLVGGNSGNINNAYATGDVSGINTVGSTYTVGGLVGDNWGNINNAYATGDVSGTGHVGGLVGFNWGNINNAYATGNVSNKASYNSYIDSNSSYNTGGLVGNNWGSISNAYATGDVSGIGLVGGLVGRYSYYDDSSTISNAYYNIDQVLINGGHYVTLGGIYETQYQNWINNNKQTLAITDYLPFDSTTGYYNINSVQGLKDLLAFADNPAYKFRLTTDIDLSNQAGLFIPHFAGEFDGAGHVISHLTLNQPFATVLGLFAQLEGAVQNLGVTHVAVTGSGSVGGLAGYNSGNINNVYVTGYVSNTSTDVYSSATGGLVGHNDWGNSISNAYAMTDVSGIGKLGGLVGDNWGNINNAYATGNVNNTDTNNYYAYYDNNTGGLVGHNQGNINNAYATGDVSGTGSVGGLVGSNGGSINNVYATGDVSNKSSYYDSYIINYHTGGLVGRNDGNIHNACATGDVSGAGRVGGLVGYDFSGYGYDFDTFSNAYYNIDQVLINGGHYVTLGGIYDTQYQNWINNNKKTLAVADYLPFDSTTGYYNINSVQSLKDLLAFADNPAYKFRLTTDIDLSNQAGLFIPYFTGEFDGANHVISNLTLNQPFAGVLGLFAKLEGTVQNLGLAHVAVTGSEYVGGLVGHFSSGDINNVYVTGSVSGTHGATGGLVGYSGSSGYSDIFNTISNAYATANVSGTYSVGGLVGINEVGKISNAYAMGNVSGTNAVGGLVGSNRWHSGISNAYATGNVSGTDYIGGLVGINEGSSIINNTYTTGKVNGANYVGGLVGYNYSTINNSFWDTQTTGKGSQSGVGYNEGGTLDNIQGKTTAEMQQLATFKQANWDIANTSGSSAIWRIYEGHTYPLLHSFLIPLTVTANNDNQTYNGLAYSGGNGVNYTGFVNQETDAVLNGQLAYEGNSQGAINTGSYIITPTGLSSNNYDISYQNGILTINKVPLTITANNDNQTYNGLAYSGGNGANYTGFVNQETDAVLNGQLTYEGNSQGAINTGSYIITPTGLTSNNYDISYQNGMLTLNKAPLTITANNDNQTYNGLAYSGGNGIRYTGFINQETDAVLNGQLAYEGNSQGAINAGFYDITPTGLTSNNYAIQFINGKLNIKPANLWIRAHNASKTFGQTIDFKGTEFSSMGLMNHETIANVDLTSLGTVATASVLNSPYNIIASNATGGTFNPDNYNITYLNGKLTVNPLIIPFDPEKPIDPENPTVFLPDAEHHKRSGVIIVNFIQPYFYDQLVPLQTSTTQKHTHALRWFYHHGLHNPFITGRYAWLFHDLKQFYALVNTNDIEVINEGIHLPERHDQD